MIATNSKLLMIVLSCVLVVLLAALVAGTYILRAKNQEISELIYSADRAGEAEELIRSIQAIQNDAKEDLEAFNNFVLSEDKLVVLIEDIEEAGRTLGLDTKIISVGKTESKKALVPDTVRIAIETHGSWAASLSFVRTMENLPHRVMIDESSQYKEDEGWRSKIILSLQSFD